MIDKPEIQHNERRETWMDPIIEYLKNGKLPDDSAGSLRTRKEALNASTGEDSPPPFLKALYVIQEVHEGICGTHIGGRALMGKITRAGYYWPTLKADCMDYVRRRSSGFVGTTTYGGISMAFSQMGNRHSGAIGQVKFLMVVVNYFTKWIEAEPMATITTKRVKCFIWKKIICRFGLPAEIVSDNGTQFASSVTTKFCQDLHIRQSFTLVEHPQANRQAEAANRVILRGLRRRLEEAKGRWVEELPQVIWSYHTTPHSTTGETPFRLTYGSEAMILVEIGEPSPRTALFEPTVNEEELRENLDLLQEVREIVHIKEYAAKVRVARKYDRKDNRKGGKGSLSVGVLGWAKNPTHLERQQLEKQAMSANRTKEIRNEELKLQDPKQMAIETDPRSEELKLQDRKQTAIETDSGSEERNPPEHYSEQSWKKQPATKDEETNRITTN
ncbi:Pol polyprotein, partial [Mucuna pruriens]